MYFMQKKVMWYESGVVLSSCTDTENFWNLINSCCMNPCCFEDSLYYVSNSVSAKGYS